MEEDDEQERIYYKFHLIRYKKLLNSQEVNSKLKELDIIQIIFYTLIISFILSLIILIIIEAHFVLITSIIGIITTYIVYLKYIFHKFRKDFKITKKDLKFFRHNSRSISSINLIFYFLILFITCLILVISLIGINILILIFVISITLLYLFFEKILIKRLING